jgi:hypothetical protein
MVIALYSELSNLSILKRVYDSNMNLVLVSN